MIATVLHDWQDDYLALVIGRVLSQGFDFSDDLKAVEN